MAAQLTGGDIVRAFRRSRRWTVATLAKRLGVNVRTVEIWEASASDPGQLVLLALAALEGKLKPWRPPTS